MTSPIAGNQFFSKIANLAGQIPKLNAAELSVDSIDINKTLKMPVVTTTQKLAITSPVEGMEVFDTTLNALSVYSGTSWMNYGGGTTTANGYTYIGNLIMQWGLFTSTSDGEETFTFPLTFPSGCLSITVNRLTPNVTEPIYVNSYSASSFIVNRADNIDDSQPMNYIAIGY